MCHQESIAFPKQSTNAAVKKSGNWKSFTQYDPQKTPLLYSLPQKLWIKMQKLDQGNVLSVNPKISVHSWRAPYHLLCQLHGCQCFMLNVWTIMYRCLFRKWQLIASSFRVWIMTKGYIILSWMKFLPTCVPVPWAVVLPVVWGKKNCSNVIPGFIAQELNIWRALYF